jgi:UDP-N-acetylglucosamine/UDP-N-acetylgalactosamine diphosphorylase
MPTTPSSVHSTNICFTHEGISLQLGRTRFRLCFLTTPQVPREDEFAPVKNAPGSGADCPETARDALSRLCVRRLVASGGTVTTAGGAATTPGAPAGEGEQAEPLLEISPLLSYAGEGLEARVKGREFALPAYIDVE